MERFVRKLFKTNELSVENPSGLLTRKCKRRIVKYSKLEQFFPTGFIYTLNTQSNVDLINFTSKEIA